MSSKNNPLNRNRNQNVKMVDGKKVKPALYISAASRYMAASFEDGKMVIDPRTGNPAAYADI